MDVSLPKRNTIIFSVVGIILFYVIFSIFSDIDKISDHFQNFNFLFLPLILSIQFLALFIRSTRQKLFLSSLGVDLSFSRNFIVYLIGMSLIFTPGGTGSVIKSFYLKKNFQTSHSKIVPVVASERYYDLFGITILIILSILFIYNVGSIIIASITSILLVSIFIIIKNKKFLKIIENKFSKINFLKKFIPGDEFHETIEKLSKPNLMIKGISLTILSWIVDAIAVFFVFQGFLQNLDLFQTLQIYYTSLAYGAISLLPGGIGITEGSLLGMLLLNNIEISIAASIVIMIRLTTIWFATVCGLTMLRFIFKN